jgi:ribose transport system substrate-binding protein
MYGRRFTLAAGLAGVLVLTAAACSSGSSSSSASSPATSSPTSNSSAIKIIYVQGQTGNPFFTSVACGAQAEAKVLGVQFSYQGGLTYSPQAQTPVLDAVIAKHPTGIIISPMIGNAMVAPLTQAKDAGIKLVYVDTHSATSLAASYVSTDNVAGGAAAAAHIASLLHGKGTVMIMGAIPGITTTDARNQGFDQQIKKYPGITQLPTQYGEADPATATAKMSAIIAAHPNLNAVFAVDTQDTEGVAVAVKDAHLAGKLIIVGFDTSPPILTDIQDGIVTGQIVQEPLLMGQIAMEQLVRYIKGEPTTPVIHTPIVFLTKSDMNDPNINKYIYKTSC